MHCRDLSSKPNLAGTRQDFEGAIKLKEFWLSSGLDESTVNPYDVFYSLPDPNRPNEVVLLDANDQIVHKTPSIEDILSPELRPRGMALPYFAHSPPGTVKVGICRVHV